MSLYIEAASILNETSGSLRSRIYHRPASSPQLKSPPARLYALIIETLKHQEILNEVIAKSELLKLERKLTHSLTLLLLHDHLLTKNGIATSPGPLRTQIESHKARLSSEFTRARLKRGFGTTALYLSHIASESAPKIPRWVRVNTLKCSLTSLLTQFPDYAKVDTLEDVMTAAKGIKTKAGGRVYYVDPYVKDLLAFPPGIDITTMPCYIKGEVILQDRSSCLPAALLDPPKEAWVVDATSAPGNKTTHAAAILHGAGGSRKGGVIAYEKDPRRAEILKRMVTRAGGDVAITVRPGEDFLKARPKSDELSRVTHLLLDPSCSGSGIVSRAEYSLLPIPEFETKTGTKRKRGGKPAAKPAVTAPAKPAVIADDAEGADGEQEETKQDVAEARLHSLAAFQTEMIQHAMTFPSARKITYSTCSIHAIENEQVVMAALQTKVAKRRGWRVLGREEGVLSEWERRGLDEECAGDHHVAQACIRANPIEDGGIGFFLCGFVREGEDDSKEEDWVEERKETVEVTVGKGKNQKGKKEEKVEKAQAREEEEEEYDEKGEEWGGFEEEEEAAPAAPAPKKAAKPANPAKKQAPRPSKPSKSAAPATPAASKPAKQTSSIIQRKTSLAPKSKKQKRK
ncbi:Similar to Putative methyltransferase C2C4.06c; acc. no. O14039 [Pyronema omphalodes CBS 100304]|uniref:Similar to Putative methyltransferase C2C4.06c acc. no. O14039 n=1 Tax=Pyronema omphalodes (strain CBS 100304) TaxID=1076935 RepID=U4LT78_PYROM|nr:Similar to Putative methyltransferase C2C4.06c; acc. no. O14039 [Pyronema omphalodes CBS 100304]